MAAIEEEVLVWRDDLEDRVLRAEAELYAKYQQELPDWWAAPSPFGTDPIEIKVGPLTITRVGIQCAGENLYLSTDEYSLLFFLASHVGVPVLEDRIKLEYYYTYLYPDSPSVQDVVDSIVKKLGNYGSMIRTRKITQYSRAYQLLDE